MAALVNRQPLLTRPLEPDMGALLEHNVELQSRTSCRSEWEIVADEQDRLLKVRNHSRLQIHFFFIFKFQIHFKEKAAGKIKGELPFANSRRNIRDELHLVLEEQFKDLNYNEAYYLPYDQLTMVAMDKKSILPTEPLTAGRLLWKHEIDFFQSIVLGIIFIKLQLNGDG